jgi:putative hydrolase of the HAD superfamily
MPATPRPISGIRAVFFDLDDTLCAYWDAARTGLRNAFETCGPLGRSSEEMAAHWASAFRKFYPEVKGDLWYATYLESGKAPRTELMRRALLEAGIDDPALAGRLSEVYAAERNTALELFPGAEELLDSLSKTSLRLGLITNGPADVQRQEIESLGIEKYFDTILIEGELGFGKPEAEVFKLAESAAGCSSEEMLFVGNSYAHDARPALEAGWHAVWFRRESDVPPSAQGERTQPEAMPEGAPEPDAIIGDLAEILTLLAPFLEAKSAEPADR